MDAPEVAVAKFAARISEWALFLSGGSFVVAACAFALELRRWFDEGVKLSMSVIPEATIIGGVRDENSYIAITATNRGSAATTITHMVLYNYPDRLSLCLSRWPLIIFKRPPPTLALVRQARAEDDDREYGSHADTACA